MLRYLLDENQRGLLWSFLKRHNSRGIHPLDILRVGDFRELPIGVDDSTILRWCEANERILITFDRNSMPDHLRVHLEMGRHCPGIFMLDSSCLLKDLSSSSWLYTPVIPTNGVTGSITCIATPQSLSASLR
jgi:hypothetical protein